MQTLFCCQLRAFISVLLMFFPLACSKVPYMFNLLGVQPSVCCNEHSKLKMTMLKDLEVTFVSSKFRITIV